MILGILAAIYLLFMRKEKAVTTGNEDNLGVAVQGSSLKVVDTSGETVLISISED